MSRETKRFEVLGVSSGSGSLRGGVRASVSAVSAHMET